MVKRPRKPLTDEQRDSMSAELKSPSTPVERVVVIGKIAAKDLDLQPNKSPEAPSEEGTPLPTDEE